MPNMTGLLALGLLTGGLLHAENRVYNSSFELGLKGYNAFTKLPLVPGLLDFPKESIVIDRQEKKWGDQSLKILCLAGHLTTLAGPQMKLAAGKSYTFSFWAKSDFANRPVTVSLCSRVQTGKNLRLFKKDGSFSIGNEWKRYSMPFTAESEYHWFNLASVSSVEGAFWLDGLQMEEGELMDYHPASGFEIAVYAPPTLLETDQLAGHVTAISYDTSIPQQEIKLGVADNHLKRTVAEKTLSIALPASKSVDMDFTFDGLRYGASKITATPDVPSSSAYTVRLHAIPEYRPTGFQTGCNGNFLGRNISIAGNKGAATLDTYGGPLQIASERVHLGHLHRAWGYDVSWRYTQPEPGKFLWDRLDRIVSEAERNHILLELTLTGNFCDNESPGQHYLPDWVIERDRSGKPEKSLLLKGETPNHRTYQPPLEDWRAYVQAVASRYKGRVAWYDLINEVNVGFPPETYLEYLKIASEEIRAADPAARIVALSATEDIGGRAAAFVKNCLALGAARYFDAISFHPYGSRMDDTKVVNAIQRIRQLRQIAGDTGVDKPFWNDEVYYLNSERVGNYLLESVFPAGSLSRRLILDMGEGLSASNPLNIDQFYHDPIAPDAIRKSWETRLFPSGDYAEQNTAASFLSGAVPVKTLELKGDVICYLFKNGDRLLGAIWSRSGETRQMEIQAPKGGGVSLFDLYGNKFKSNTPGIPLEITRQPQYLEWTGCTFDAIASTF